MYKKLFAIALALCLAAGAFFGTLATVQSVDSADHSVTMCDLDWAEDNS